VLFLLFFLLFPVGGFGDTVVRVGSWVEGTCSFWLSVLGCWDFCRDGSLAACFTILHRILREIERERSSVFFVGKVFFVPQSFELSRTV